MTALATSEVPRGTDTFGGLLRHGETPEQALRRLEKTKAYTRTIGTDEGQRLLAAATAQVVAAPNGGIPPKRSGCRGGHPGWRDYICIACGKDVRGKHPGAFRDAGDGPPVAQASWVEPTTELTCVGSNHVPGCEHLSTRRPAARLEHLPLASIDVGENVRADPGSLEDLVASIDELGILQPVRAIGPNSTGRYRLVWGQRRYLACIQLGLSTIPALVEASADVDAPGPKRSIEQLAENLQRKDLNPIEEALALRAVLDGDPDLTQEALADKLGRSRPWLSNSLRLLSLAEPALEAVRSGTLSASHGRALAGLAPAVQVSIVESGVKQSSHQLEQTIAWRVDEAENKRKVAERTDKQIPKAIAALEAAGVAKDIAIVAPYSYNLDSERLQAGIKKAGWKLEHGSYGRGAASKCACKAVRLEFERKWVVTPACIDVRHVDRQRNADQLASKAERELLERRLGVLREAIAGALTAAALPDPILRLFWRQARRAAGWFSGPAEEPPADLPKAISEVVATEWMLRDVDLGELFGSLGVELPQAAS